MKKLSKTTCLFAALFLLLTLLPGCSQKSNTVTVYCVSSITTASSNKLFTYDERGNLLEEFYESTNNEYTRVRTYDENDNLLTETTYDAKGQQIGDHITHTYDQQGNLLTENRTDAKGNSSGTSYTYDEQGHLLTESRTDAKGNSSTTSYTYDEQGRLLSENHVTIDGAVQPRVKYTYDRRGNLLTEEYLSAGEVVQKNQFTYDRKGNMLTQEAHARGSSFRYEWTYDYQGRKLTERYLINGSVRAVTNYRYDRRGNLLEEIDSTANGEPICQLKITYDQQSRRISGEMLKGDHHFVCTYDENGNLYAVNHHAYPLVEVEYIRLEIPRQALEKVQEQQQALLKSYTPEAFKENYG